MKGKWSANPQCIARAPEENAEARTFDLAFDRRPELGNGVTFTAPRRSSGRSGPAVSATAGEADAEQCETEERGGGFGDYNVVRDAEFSDSEVGRG